MTQDHHSPGCDKHWNKLLQLWTRVDSLVQTKIAQANEAPTQEDQKAGNMMISEETLCLEMDHLENSKINCQIITCQAPAICIDHQNLGKVSKRSISSQQECEETSLVEEVKTRNDEGYLEWKNWMTRDKL